MSLGLDLLETLTEDVLDLLVARTPMQLKMKLLNLSTLLVI
jgi:hypothetical protein